MSLSVVKRDVQNQQQNILKLSIKFTPELKSINSFLVRKLGYRKTKVTLCAIFPITNFKMTVNVSIKSLTLC